MKKAVIVGCDGQDGSFLYDLLLGKRYSIVGLARSAVKSNNKWNRSIDITNPDHVDDLIQELQPDEAYFLAAFHQSSEHETRIKETQFLNDNFNINVFALINFLEAIRRFSSRTKIFYAASSKIFGKPSVEPQNENTRINPVCVYGVTKATGLLTCRLYRNKYDVFASTGILYNHESNLRDKTYVTRKIIKSAVNIKRGSFDKLTLNNLEDMVDWGYAPDFVDAYQRILSLEKPDDFIVATGIKNNVKDFAKMTFDHLGLNWKDHVNAITAKPQEQFSLVGDATKLSKATGWQPSMDLKTMIKVLLAQEGEDFEA